MAAQSTIFPIFLRAEYREDANGIPQFISRIQQAAKISEAELSRVGNALNKALSAPRTGAGALDLGTAQLREQIKAQEQAAMVARELQAATTIVAKANLDLSAALRPSIQAYGELAKAKENGAASDRAQLAAMQAVEAELEKGTRAVQARLQAEQQLANFRKSANLNDGAARILSGRGALDRAAVSGVTLDSVLGRTRASNPVVAKQRAQEAAEAERAAAAQAAEMERVAAAAAKQAAAMAELSRAEAGAAASAQLLQAIYRGTALELNSTGTEFARVTKSARDSAAAFQQMFAAQEAEATKAAAALKKQAAALASLKAQINPAAAAQEQFNQKVAFAQAALDRGELSQQEYARAVRLAASELRQAGQAEVAAAAARNGFTAATKAGTTARGNVINSVRAERTAFIQLGQQLQDVAVQAQMGTNAFLIFGQQAPQAAFALSGLADSANRTQRAIGNVATFLSGPWGAAVFVAIAALGPFVQKLFESSDAANKAGRSISELVAEKARSAVESRNAAIAEDVFARTLDGVTEAVRRNREAIERLTVAKRTDAEETLRNSRIQLANALALQFNTQQQIFNAKAILDAQVARASGPGQGNELAALGIAGKQANLDQALASLVAGAGEIAEITRQINEASVLVAVERGLEGAEGQIKRRYEAEVEGLKRTAQARGLSTAEIEREAAAIKARERAELDGLKPDRSGAASQRRAAREAQQLAKFGESAAEQIQRINERFDEQPRLIDAAAQATRQLDAIIKVLGERNPANFEKMIADAEKAKGVIQQAVQRPIEQIRQESEQRLKIEEALAAGQIDRAAALQEIFRLEQQIGNLTDAQRDEVESIVMFEQQRLRILRDQQAVFNAQLDVVDSVRQSLTDILSGRSTDFFGNFRQALQDLQGKRLFESIFGQTFRDIEDELQGNTPQGRANLRLAQQVDQTADTVSVAKDALADLADAFGVAAARIRNGGAANDNGFAAAFGNGGSVGGAAAGVGGAAQRLLSAAGLGGITVTGRRPADISRNSITDLAARISKGIGDSIGAQLEDVLGPRFASLLGDVVGGAVAGKTLGGTPGGILGGLEGLTKNIKGLEGVTAALGKAGAGAQVGTTVNGIGNMLGIKGSATGAQIGGAIGSFIPIPGGQIIGAIAGNIIGGLLKKTPRASATIGGVGGGLGLTSVTGTSASLREAAGGLGGSVLEAVNRIAEQLGARVNAGAGSVSIGQRKGNLRVDTSGRGITKVGNGAVDFGDDAEAAVAFAVRDLIQDGVITGLRQSEQNLLRAGKDVEASLADVLRFRSVFDQLDEIRDPVGSAVRKLNTEFESLIDLFKRAGAGTEEFADLEELYNIRRAQAIEEATDRVVGSLRQLLNDLKIGDSGLSLRDRRSNALGQFDALAARVAAGDTSAFDDFADISQQLLDIERQLFGSTQAYFDRLNQVTALTERAIADQTNVTSIGAGQPSPFGDSTSIARTIEATSAEQVSILRAINDNLITALSPALRPAVSGGAGGFNSPMPTFIQNF